MQSGTGINWSSCGSAGPAAAGQRQPVAKPYRGWLAELSHPLRDLQTVVDDYRSALGKSLCGRCPIPLERCTPVWASELGSSAASPVCGTLHCLLQWGGPR